MAAMHLRGGNEKERPPNWSRTNILYLIVFLTA
jgi:hypothetical protein